jgi:hypothetical protein
MLKFLYVVRVFNFRIFLTDLSPDFKHVILSRLDKLLGLRYIVGKLQISSFQPNFNRNKIPPIAPYMS